MEEHGKRTVNTWRVHVRSKEQMGRDDIRAVFVIQPRLLLMLLLTFSVLVANPKKTTLHGGQSRSWSAEQGKENKIKSLMERKNIYICIHIVGADSGSNNEVLVWFTYQ